MLLIDTTVDNALILAERLRLALSGESIETAAGTISVTISLGISQLSADVEDHERWIETADQARYRAKRGGRNRSVVHQTDSAAE